MAKTMTMKANRRSVAHKRRRSRATPSRHRASDSALDTRAPELPPPDEKGYYPAAETLRAMLARDIIRRRRTARLTREELAHRAHIRLQSLIRLEEGKESPSVRIVDKIEEALKRAGV